MNMFNRMQTTLVTMVLFCACSLCTYGQEEECIQKFAEFAKKVESLNQANLNVLEQANLDGQDVPESRLRELRDQSNAIMKEAVALYTEFTEKGVVINLLPQGMEILSDIRFRTYSITARFRKLWKDMSKRKIISGTEEEVLLKWSFFDLSIRDRKRLHSDTEKRVTDCITNIKGYRNDIALLLAKASSETDEEEVTSRLAKLVEAIEMEYLIACEYIINDPVGAEEIRKELDKTVTFYEEGHFELSP